MIFTVTFISLPPFPWIFVSIFLLTLSSPMSLCSIVIGDRTGCAGPVNLTAVGWHQFHRIYGTSSFTQVKFGFLLIILLKFHEDFHGLLKYWHWKRKTKGAGCLQTFSIHWLLCQNACKIAVSIGNLWLKDKPTIICQEAETFNLQMATSRVLPRVIWKGQS